jgi:hypothetical protein
MAMMYLSDCIPETELEAVAVAAELPEPPSRAYIERRDSSEIGMLLGDYAEEDSWVLEDFDDLIPDHY